MFKLFRNILRNLEALSARGDGYKMSKKMRERFRSPSVNVDGTPMVGRHDIRGRGYGSGRRYGSSR
jgi:hypothetical protein